MAASPPFKVYSADGEYLASAKYPEDAAVWVAFRGDGATIRYGHTRIVWHEGKEDQPAGESYDHVAEVVARRLRYLQEAKLS